MCATVRVVWRRSINTVVRGETLRRGGMSYSQRRDQRRANAEQLVRWLETNQPATLARVVSTGVMNMADAANALQYGIRHRIIERDDLPDVGAGGAHQYRLTGRPLVFERPSIVANPFDALLTAWGIARVPPELPGRLSVRVMLG